MMEAEEGDQRSDTATYRSISADRRRNLIHNRSPLVDKPDCPTPPKGGLEQHMSSNTLSILQLQNTQYLHSLNPETLLPIELAAHLLNKSASTLRTDITRRPQSLPIFVRFGRRVFFLKRDIDSFIAASRCTQPQPFAASASPSPSSRSRKRGRPTKAEHLARLAAEAKIEVRHA